MARALLRSFFLMFVCGVGGVMVLFWVAEGGRVGCLC